MKTVIVVQARMTSTRLPGKVLREVLGRPLLSYQIERLRRVRNADAIVIATTTNSTDQPIVALCEKLGVPFFRGSEEDVLSRYLEAAKQEKADVVVRVTSDCPLIDPVRVDEVIEFYKKEKFDYVSNSLKRTFPRGLDCEVFAFERLAFAAKTATLKRDREHVTSFFYTQPEVFKVGHVLHTPSLGHLRWTVDTPEDFELVSKLLEECYPAKSDFLMEDVLAVLSQNPQWSEINADVEQKKLDSAMRAWIRVDASLEIGTGHVQRCLTLARGLRAQGVNVIFVSRLLAGNLCELIEKNEFRVVRLPALSVEKSPSSDSRTWLGVDWKVDSEQTIEAVKGSDPAQNLLIVDHYGIDEEWETSLRPYVKKILVVDDLANRKHDCDLLLDQNQIPPDESRYKGWIPKRCRQLLGPRYCLLRKEFETNEKSVSELGRRVFVFFGGVDAVDETSKVLRALSFFPDLEVDLVLSAQSPHLTKVKNLIQNNGKFTLHTQPESIADLMKKSDFALGAGGTTTWERFALGLPSIVVSVAENQTEILKNLAARGLVLYLGASQDVSVEDWKAAIATLAKSKQSRVAYSRAGREWVDGRGVSRVVRRVLNPKTEIRRVLEHECDSLYTWRNAEENRKFAFDDRPIELVEHRAWFKRVLADPNRFLLIGEIENEPVGVLRYDVDPHGQALVSIYLVPGKGGMGYGPQLLEEGHLWMEKNCPHAKVAVAAVRNANYPSERAFLEAGFVKKNSIFEKEL